MRVVELFGGGGGAWQGLTAAGVDVVRSIEYDEAAHNVAKAAGCPSVLGDVRDLSLLDGVGAVDLLWSSFPCQAFSSAGKRKGAEDERNGWPWTVAAIDHLDPTWLMAENVQGLLTHSAEHCGDPVKCPGCYFHRVILPELRERFAWVGYSVSNAADFGTPQHRRRVCIVAGPRAVRWPETTHAKPEDCMDLFSRRKPWTTVCEALGLDAYVQSGVAASDPGTHGAACLVDGPAPCVPVSSQIYHHPAVGPVRALSLRETRILMGWHERYDAILATQTKTAAYRVLGNGCVPAWVEAHARAVMEA